MACVDGHHTLPDADIFGGLDVARCRMMAPGTTQCAGLKRGFAGQAVEIQSLNLSPSRDLQRSALPSQATIHSIPTHITKSINILIGQK
jgi:hypothetical protein